MHIAVQIIVNCESIKPVWIRIVMIRVPSGRDAGGGSNEFISYLGTFSFFYSVRYMILSAIFVIDSTKQNCNSHKFSLRMCFFFFLRDLQGNNITVVHEADLQHLAKLRIL